jgi:hypothetical protein
MLKRDGQLCKHSVPGFVGKLTPAEFDTYNAAFDTIKDEFVLLGQIKDALKELTLNPSAFTIPDSQFANQSVETPHAERDDLNFRWEIRSQLLRLNRSDVFLCERMTDEGKQYAAIERYKNNSEYARVYGNAAVLLASNDPLLAVQDYAACAEHTLRFMASNMVATAQKVVWERVASQNPSRVIEAISERCSQAVGEAQNEIQAQILNQKLSPRQSIGHKV